MSTKSTAQMTTNFSDVNVSNLSFTKLEDNDRSKGQRIAYPRYNHPEQGADAPLFIQFPWVLLNQYGIPRLGDYFKDDSQRSFIKIPLDQSDPEVKKFCELLQEIDQTLGSDETKKKLFEAKANKYEYQSIFRLPQEDDEDAPKDPKKKDYGPKHPYMKLKIDTTFPDNQVKSIVFNSILENGKRVRTKVTDIKTIDDFSRHVCFLSKIRPIGRPVKLWAQTKPSGSNKTMGYGLTFKLAKIEVEPPVKANSQVKEFMESDAFLDSDEESDTIQTTSVAKGGASASASVSAKPAPKPSTQSTQPTQKQTAQVESDDDSDDDSSDDAPAPKGKPTQATKDDSEDDSNESDEDVKPPKPAPKVQPRTQAGRGGKTARA